MRLFVFAFLFSLLPVFLPAQEDSLRLRKSLNINYDNDYFTQVDYYYTQGTYIEFYLPALRKNPVSKILFALPKGNDEAFGISINQQCFTPSSIRSNFIRYGDRPFSSNLYLGFSRMSLKEKKRLRMRSEIQLGMIGPLGFGEQIQMGLHKWTHSQTPEGWQFQISNAPLLNYSTEIEKAFISQAYFDGQVFSTLRAGTVYDDVKAGLNLRAGRMNPYFEREASSKLRFWTFVKTDVSLVAYNAMLQGGFFTVNPYVISAHDVSRAVFSATYGMVLAYKKVSLEYTKVYITPEFKTGEEHSWGHVNLIVQF